VSWKRKFFRAFSGTVFWRVFLGMVDLLLEPPILMLIIGILLQIGYVVQELILKLREGANQ
jgi:fumarate reductase subunit D